MLFNFTLERAAQRQSLQGTLDCKVKTYVIKEEARQSDDPYEQQRVAWKCQEQQTGQNTTSGEGSW